MHYIFIANGKKYSGVIIMPIIMFSEPVSRILCCKFIYNHIQVNFRPYLYIKDSKMFINKFEYLIVKFILHKTFKYVNR